MSWTTLSPISTITPSSTTNSTATDSVSLTSSVGPPVSQPSGSGTGTSSTRTGTGTRTSNSRGDASRTSTSSISSLSASSSLTATTAPSSTEPQASTSPSISPTTTPLTILPTSTSPSGTTTLSSSSNPSTSTISGPRPSSTCDPTPADTGILDNGDFETGLSPWSLDLVDLFSTDYTLSSSLSSSSPLPFLGLGGANGSCTSFAVSMAANPQTQNLLENLRLRSDLVFSRPGASLRISFFVRFALRNSASLALSANGQVIRVLSAVEFGPGGGLEGGNSSSSSGGGGGGGGVGSRRRRRRGGGGGGGEWKGKAKGKRQDEGLGEWTRVVVDYVTRDRLLQLTFSYGLDSAPLNVVWLDQVAIFPTTAFVPPTPLPSSTTFATTVARSAA
ncbi:hypothetical protein F4859DRAFT_510116 [Xylaria cf. heliscus]|nr:hypothetical protein F4859DRAFT_510116 [Xylaria cf. heliscus]